MIPFEPSEISSWANRPDANHQLPELIRRLILATVPDLSRLDMPSGSAVWLSGWDGQLKAETGNAWVPKGSSVWELSCRSDVGAKANDDYRKRTDPPQGDPDTTATFVFVTARQWNGKEQWAEARRGDGKWADVCAYDANNLIAWLGQAPAVAEWFGGVLGKLPSDGYTTLDEWWENWATVAEPNIGPSLVVAGRQDSTDRLSEWIQQTPSAYYVQARTREEAIAFVAASARNSDVAWGAALLARALVVKSEDAWNSLVRHTSPLVLIRAFDGNVSSQVATGRGHHVITLLHASEAPRGNGVQLSMLGRDETVAALTEMSLSESDSRALVRKTARSLPVMRRFLIEESGGAPPGWSSVDPQSLLPTLMLVGQWDETNESDRETIAKIVARPYEEVAREAAALAQIEDNPLMKVGSRWRFLSHEEAWHLLAPRLTTDDVGRFTEEAVLVLEAESTEYELSVEERHLAAIQGKGVPHSRLLREGIARTLALMGNQGERAQNIEDVPYRPIMVLRRVLAEDKGWEIWATLSRDLATLAEAGPETVLEAIEHRLSATPGSFEDLFHQEGDPLFGGAQHTGLLWALERLAWAPEYFSRVAVILARLARTDPGGRISNRPAESLKTMFLPWFRVSEASDPQRLETLGTLLSRVPEVGWKTLCRAYPSVPWDGVMGRERPLWRPWAQDGVPRPTCAEYYAFVAGMDQRLLEHVGEDADRWEDVVGLISDLSPSTRQQATMLMALRAAALKQQPNSANLWSQLRTQLNRHRSYPDAKWAMPETELNPLAAIYDELTPSDPAMAHGWLFSGRPDLPDGSDRRDLESHHARLDAARQSAIVAAYESDGPEAILSIARSAEQSGEVGRAFFIGVGAAPALELALEHAGSEVANYQLMARGIFWTLFHQCGWPALDDLLERAKVADVPAQAVANMFLAAPADRETWLRLSEQKSEVQRCYWELMYPWGVSREDEADIDFVALKLLEYHRAPAVAEWISHQPVHHEIVIHTLEQLPADLMGASGPEARSGWSIYDITSLLEKLDETEAVDDITIAHLELPFISGLSHDSRRDLALHREISRDPALFADLVAHMCRRDDGQSDDAVNEQAVWVAGNILVPIMMGQGIIPGRTEDGAVDYEALTVWVNEARRLCAERGRGEVGDDFIGQLLSKAPIGDDEIWPCEPVRELLEQVGSQNIANGFSVGTHNLRGVTSRGAFDGGGQERTLSGEYRRQANEIGARWPTTSGLLRRIAESYEREARWHDRDAEERDRFGF